LSPSLGRARKKAIALITTMLCLRIMLFGRLHIGAFASASRSGWQVSVAGTGEYRMVVLDVLEMC
jgi:hypothetical protein